MDPPIAAEVETKPLRTDETKGGGKTYDCGLCDTEVVYRIAQELLPGLASACVDNTTGGIFKSAGSVAVDMRKEMVYYLTQRSETYVAEFLLAENASGEEVSEHPYDIIIGLIDDFAASKRNMFSRVSEWVLSDRREDRIDDFVQEMEINGFWLLARRECVASMLLKNVDYKNAFHCNMVCSSEEEVAEHRSDCKFRPIDCTNEGCTTRYCAAQKGNHEAICPFMILPCEQKCSDFVMRREMDRHCVTVCPMKLVNCAFYTVGCNSSIPRCNVQQHNADNLSSHLLYILRAAHKEATDDDLKHRVEQIRHLSNTEKLARARDARALTYLIKDAEAKLGQLEVNTKPHTIKEEKPPASPSHDGSDKKEPPTKTKASSMGDAAMVKDGSDSPNKESPTVMESSTEKPVTTKEDDTELPTKEDVHPKPVELTITRKGSADWSDNVDETEDKMESSSLRLEEEKDEHGESTTKEEASRDLPATKEEEQKESAKKETVEEASHVEEKGTAKSPERELFEEPFDTVEEESMKSPKKETIKESSSSDEESKKSPENDKSKESSGSDEESMKSPRQESFYESSRSDEEESMKSPSHTES